MLKVNICLKIERRTTVIVNKLKTKQLKLLSFATFIIALSVLTILCVSALADTDENVENSGEVLSEIPSFTQTVEQSAQYTGPVEFTVVEDGEVNKHKFFPVECSEFLKYEGIELDESDFISFPLDEKLYNNAVINIGKLEYVYETKTETTKFAVVENEIKTIPKGTKRVSSPGENGVVERSYIVKYVNGQKVDMALLYEDVISMPKDEIVDVGVGGVVTASDGTQYNYSYYMPMEATAYTYVPGLTTMTTATGERLRKGIVAVDPKVIPLHTKMFITGSIEYGLGVAEDTGGAIKGNIVDLAYMSYDECIQFGRRNVVVYILE